MPVRIFNSLTRKVEELQTREANRVSMYCCGPTVYNYIHIGNARTFLWFDFVARYLAYRGFDVTFVMNYTDVDDKIIERAALEKVPADAITAKYAKAFEEDMAALGARSADVICRATDHIDDMIEAIQGLIDNGVAYDSGGDVFFAVEAFPGYGKLSGRSLDDMRAGERVEPHEAKRNPLDFALWKSAKEGEVSWPSPWGPGRPGWHIECSVMSSKYLGFGFDIHGGGSDLIFPHHENEIAQAEGLSGSEPFARQWLHAGMVQMETEKMSKSIGNIVLAHDAVEKYGGDALRYWALMASYRSQSTYSPAVLDDAAQSYERWRNLYLAAVHLLGDDMPERPTEPRRGDDLSDERGYITRFIEAMDDDFNSAGAFAVVHDLVGEANRKVEAAQQGDDAARAEVLALTGDFLELTGVLGFSFAAPVESSQLTGGLIGYLIELREQARAEKNFAGADEIRDRLSDMGVVLEDTPSGTRWHIAR